MSDWISVKDAIPFHDEDQDYGISKVVNVRTKHGIQKGFYSAYSSMWYTDEGPMEEGNPELNKIAIEWQSLPKSKESQ